MSKAFLRESDFDDSAELPPPAALLPPGARNYLTARGANELQAQLSVLIDESRPPLAARSDDPETRRALRLIDQRIRHLEQSLRSAEIVPPAPSSDGVVRFGCTVRVRDSDGDESVYQIVGVDESDASAGRVSWTSPLARALLNARSGDRVIFQTPAGPRELAIVAVTVD